MDLAGVARHDPRRHDSSDDEAAVLVPVLTREDAHQILFTKRAAHLGEHPGQMSFPGGGREPHDDSLFETATREANEEIALEPASVDRVGCLDDVRTTTGYAITPYVARVPDRPYVPNDREVAEIVVFPVEAFLKRADYRVEEQDHPRFGEVRVHHFDLRDYTVWGATARILLQLLSLATDWQAAAPVGGPRDPDP